MINWELLLDDAFILSEFSSSFQVMISVNNSVLNIMKWDRSNCATTGLVNIYICDGVEPTWIISIYVAYHIISLWKSLLLDEQLHVSWMLNKVRTYPLSPI